MVSLIWSAFLKDDRQDASGNESHTDTLLPVQQQHMQARMIQCACYVQSFFPVFPLLACHILTPAGAHKKAVFACLATDVKTNFYL